MRRVRRAEQRAAAAAVGVTDVRFLGYPDGRLYVTHELRRDIVRVIRQVRPQRVLAQSPERDWTRIGASHPDHLAAGEATVAAVYPDARNEFAHPELLAHEGLEAHTVPDLWLMAAPAGRGQVRYVDVTDGFDRKLAALRAHASQIVNIPDLEGLLRQWMGANARAAGFADGRLAESFQVVDAS
jgi:LmbE family N-acetylglucosaminyl deacetylase